MILMMKDDGGIFWIISNIHNIYIYCEREFVTIRVSRHIFEEVLNLLNTYVYF